MSTLIFANMAILATLQGPWRAITAYSTREALFIAILAT